MAIKAVSGTAVEASGGNADSIVGDMRPAWQDQPAALRVTGMNGFLQAVHRAFADHYPLVLSPDDVWLAIAQGFALHVNVNAEKLRSKFVKHEGQKYLEISRDHFVKGSPHNDWPGAFTEFSDKIAEHIGKKRDLVVGRFSTTGPIEQAASEVVLMDAMRAYFTYGVQTCCGIPSITLLGKTDDWKQIRERVSALSEYECEPWAKTLGGVIDHFVAVAKGNADPKFWGSFYKLGGGSGGPNVNGAINAFFPYLTCHGTKVINKFAMAAETWEEAGWGRHGPHTNDFPMGLSTVPFKWHYHNATFDMSFLGGFAGVTQDPKTLALRPVTAWGIADAKQDR